MKRSKWTFPSQVLKHRNPANSTTECARSCWDMHKFKGYISFGRQKTAACNGSLCECKCSTTSRLTKDFLEQDPNFNIYRAKEGLIIVLNLITLNRLSRRFIQIIF